MTIIWINSVSSSRNEDRRKIDQISIFDTSSGSDSHMTYVINIAPGEHAQMALFLIRSIRHLQPQSTIVAYVVDEEQKGIDESVMHELEQTTTVHRGSVPIDGYPISAKIAAMKTAAEATDDKRTVLLDTDVLMIDELTLPDDSEAELYAKPVDMAGKGTRSRLWEDVYTTLDIPLPDFRIRSTVDNRDIFPYWNAGVVVSHSASVPKRWLRATEKIYHELEIKSRFIDQLALGAVSTEFAHQPLTENQNFPLPHRLTVPNNTQLLHYHSYKHLRRALDGSSRQTMYVIGMSDYLNAKRNGRLSVLRGTISSLAKPCRRIISIK